MCCLDVMRKELLTSYALGVWNRLVTVTKPGQDGLGNCFGNNISSSNCWGDRGILTTFTERSESVADYDQAGKGGLEHCYTEGSLNGQR
jgi:hypothetical protein